MLLHVIIERVQFLKASKKIQVLTVMLGMLNT